MTPEDSLNYRPAGPGKMTCRSCSTTISTNALARAGHERGDRHFYGPCRGTAFAGHGDCILARGHQERGQAECKDERGRRWLFRETERSTP